MTQGQQQSRRGRHREEGVWELDRGITEISGEGGSGKTQICLSMCVSCVMTPFLQPGLADRGEQALDGGHYIAIYVSMGEGIRTVTIARRLEQMVRARLIDGRMYDLIGNDAIIKRILSCIVLFSICNEDEFADFVEEDLPDLLDRIDERGGTNNRRQRTKIGLVEFDGIAGFFSFSDPSLFHRSNEKSSFYQRRGSRLLRVSSRLRELSDVLDIPILITNQVTAFAEQICASSCPKPSSLVSSMTCDEQYRWAVPALGLAWSNCVTTRCILRRTDRMVDAMTEMIRGGQKRPINAEGIEIITGSQRMMRVREARILQTVNMPSDLEVQFVIGSGDVIVLA